MRFCVGLMESLPLLIFVLFVCTVLSKGVGRKISRKEGANEKKD